MERGKNTKGGRTCSTRCQDFQQSNNYEWYWYKDRQINGGKSGQSRHEPMYIWTLKWVWKSTEQGPQNWVSSLDLNLVYGHMAARQGHSLLLWQNQQEVTGCRELALWLLHENRPAEAPQFEILLAYNKWINLCNNKTWVKIICNWKLWPVQTSIKQEE